MILRAATIDDAQFLLTLRADPEALKYMPLRPLNLSEMQARIAAAGSQIDVDDTAELMFIVEVAGQAIGLMGVNQCAPQMEYAEVAYSILPAHQGRGLATQALRLWVSQLFAAGYRRLGAMVSANNRPSLALAQRVGFVQEGLLRQHFIVAGEVQDQVVFGLLATEWPQTLQGSQNVPD